MGCGVRCHPGPPHDLRLVCPLQFPDTPKRAELLHHCLSHRRQLAPHPLPSKAGPLLYRAKGAANSELLMALKAREAEQSLPSPPLPPANPNHPGDSHAASRNSKVTNLSEEQAHELLEEKSWESPLLQPGPQEPSAV